MPVEVEDFVHSGTMAAKVGWGDLPPVVVGEGIEGISRARNLGDAALLGAVRSFEARGEHRGEGHSSVVGWLQHHCRMRKATARRIARLARFLPKLPCVEEALASGEVGFDHVEVLADAYKDEYAEAWEAVTPKLLTFALHGPVRGLRPVRPQVRRRPLSEGPRGRVQGAGRRPLLLPGGDPRRVRSSRRLAHPLRPGRDPG